MKAERQPVYYALDQLPDAVFAALLYAISGMNRVLALTVLDDPTPSIKLNEVIEPFMKKLE